MSDVRPSRWRRTVSRGLQLAATLAGFCCVHAVTAAPIDDEQVIVPNSAVGVNAPAAAAKGTGPLTMVGVLVLGGAGGWLLWRSRAGGLKQFNRAPRNLAVEETRALGNRQYLVVASYQDRKFLIGVCPGRIDLLSALDGAPVREAEKLHL